MFEALNYLIIRVKIFEEIKYGLKELPACLKKLLSGENIGKLIINTELEPNL